MVTLCEGSYQLVGPVKDDERSRQRICFPRGARRPWDIQGTGIAGRNFKMSDNLTMGNWERRQRSNFERVWQQYDQKHG
jgi:hypothetical protein